MPYMRLMRRPILLYPDPQLKQVCAPVEDLSDGLRTLADEMLQTMYAAPGVGLAAPQVGVLRRLIVMDCATEGDPQPVIMFNPQIEAASDTHSVHEEGCLSLPEQFADITRPAEVRVRWIDRNGVWQVGDFSGLWATCVQHEIDHLDGRLFIDYLSLARRHMMTRKALKIKRARMQQG